MFERIKNQSNNSNEINPLGIEGEPFFAQRLIWKINYGMNFSCYRIYHLGYLNGLLVGLL
jgi:hypothetical protein